MWKYFHAMNLESGKGWNDSAGLTLESGDPWKCSGGLNLESGSPWKYFQALPLSISGSPTPISYLLTRRVGAERCTFTFFGLDALVSFTFSSLDSSAFSLRDFLDDFVSATCCAVSGFR